MSGAGDESAGRQNRHERFVRSFSEVSYDSEEEQYDVLTPIPETPADQIDGEITSHGYEKPVVEEKEKSIIPFKTIFKASGAYASSKRQFWLPGTDVKIKITGYERQELKILNPNLYSIQVNHGEHEWVVRRRYKHFRQLHDALVLFRTRYNMPLPRSGKAKEHKKTLKRQWRAHESVKMPLTPEALISEENIPYRMERLEKYLQSLICCKAYRNNPETVNFFEVSHLSFVARLGPKLKEDIIKKCSGGRRISIGCCGCFQKVHFAGRWMSRWLVLKDTYMAYIRPEDGVISDVMLMDKDFKVECGMKVTGATHGLMISNLNRHLLVKCWTSRKAKEWAEQIETVKKKYATDFTKTNRFHSFAPIREESYAQWFVDSASYFDAVAEALDKAKEEIYITDWWLSPEIYMKRPILHGNYWRLDNILARKADQGVKVFILLYKEIEAALGIKSLYSKQVLMKKNKDNIKVLRHPDHIPGKGILMWAHHEKLVAVDQQIAFIGGIDLCYGRWDDPFHRLTDLGSITLNHPPSPASISRREQESNVTDFTELNDDLRSVDSPSSLRPFRHAAQNSHAAPHYNKNSHADPHYNKKVAAKPATLPSGGGTSGAVRLGDMNMSIIHPLPVKGKTDFSADSECSALDRAGDQSVILETERRETNVESRGNPSSEQNMPSSSVDRGDLSEGTPREHVFVNVVLNSQDSSATDSETGDVTAGDEREATVPTSRGEIVTLGEDFADTCTALTHNVPIMKKQVVQDFDNRTASVDSTTSTASTKRHLWSDRGALKLKIPKRQSDEEVEETNIDNIQKDNVGMPQVLAIADPSDQNERVRASSHTSDTTSKTSDSSLIIKEEVLELRAKPPASAPVRMTQSEGGSRTARDTLDFKGAANVTKVLRKKGRHEENNNKGRHSDGDMSSSSQARRRWKMVFNVQKFESTVRHTQVDRIPAKLLLPQGQRKMVSLMEYL